MLAAMVESSSPNWSSDRLYARVAEKLNNQVHSVTGYTPFEVLRGRKNYGYLAAQARDLGLPMPPDVSQLSAVEVEEMRSKAEAGIRKQAAKMIANSTDPEFKPYKVGDDVWVFAYRSASGRKELHRAIDCAAQIVGFHEPDKYHLKWITQGPRKKDKPNTYSSTVFHHACVPAVVAQAPRPPNPPCERRDIFPVEREVLEKFLQTFDEGKEEPADDNESDAGELDEGLWEIKDVLEKRELLDGRRKINTYLVQWSEPGSEPTWVQEYVRPQLCNCESTKVRNYIIASPSRFAIT